MLQLLNTRDVARIYNVTSATVLNWIRAGKLKAYATPGGHFRVAREDLDIFSRQYGPPPAADSGLRLLLVGADPDVFERLLGEVHSRWPAAQVEHARSEFEIGWWLARLRPTHIAASSRLTAAHPAHTPSALIEHYRRLTAGADDQDPRLSMLPESPDEDWGDWVEREFITG